MWRYAALACIYGALADVNEDYRVKSRLKTRKNKRSPRLNADDRRLIETLATFANLQPEDVAKFRRGVLESSKRDGSAKVLANFLPEICWKLPAPSSSPASPPLSVSEGLLGWQEVQQLVRDLWDSSPPFPYEPTYTIWNRLELYSMIAAVPNQEREALQRSTLDPLPPVSTHEMDSEYVAELQKRPYTFNLAGPTREPRPEEYMFIYSNWMTSNKGAPAIKKTSLCQHAVSFMLFNRWRAKSCRKCRSRYIALEQQSRYCSNDCSYAYRVISNRDSRNKCYAKNREKYNLARQKANKQ